MRHVLLPALLVLSSAMIQAAETPPASPVRLKVGDSAPAFTLKDQNGKDVSLQEFRGKKSVILAFFVFAFTGG